MDSGKVDKQLPWQPNTVTLILKILPTEAALISFLNFEVLTEEEF